MRGIIVNKWQEKTIKHLVNRGYDEFTASKIYLRAYKRLAPSKLSTGYNRNFEAYASIVFENNFIKFDIKNNRLFYVDTGKDVSTTTFERNYTINRLEKFGKKYFDVRMMINEYEEGKISLNELNNFIKDFKKNNREYHKEGS